ncbi:MAG: energy-coupling factor transporter ATPase [Litorilinea sp.]
MPVDPILRIENLSFHYPVSGEHSHGEQPADDAPPAGAPLALRNIHLTIQPGEYVAIVGANGSGKSTLGKQLNGLLLPSTGDVWVKEWNTKDHTHRQDIRATVGMVFQNPDNQIVATVVEEDVAFGPENLGIPRGELQARVTWALEQVGLQDLRTRAPHMLSGGQKQRVCIAGVLAMHPQVLVLDESTAMLDPRGRADVLATAQRLNREQGVTIIAITHFMAETIHADRVIVLEAGEIVMDEPPRQLFAQAERLRDLQLDVPQVTELARALHAITGDFPTDVLTVDELTAAVQARLGDTPLAPGAPRTLGAGDMADTSLPTPQPAESASPAPLIRARGLTHDYMRGTPLEVRALHDVTLDIYPNEIVGLIGHTGSGKSTAVQYFNGLLRGKPGQVHVLGQDVSAANADVRTLRREVGLVMQFPEAQLFERYVGDDVAFGPRNLKLDRAEVRARVRRAMEAVGLGFEEFKDRLTFSLSGGQMRRVALAGVLAMEPRVLILDEPSAGLDPQGRRQLLRHIRDLHDQGMTLVIISHNMEELAQLCDRFYVFAGGKTVYHGTPAQIFAQPQALAELGLEPPPVTQIMHRLAGADADPHAPAYSLAYTVEETARILGAQLRAKL